MIRAAITGGIASGKSTILEMFAALPHVATLSADAVVHELYKPGQAVHRAVSEAFGNEILDPGVRIDRKKLADEAFRSPVRLRQLEAIVHPAVMAYEVAWMDKLEKTDKTETSSPQTKLAIIEIPLLFESKSEGKFGTTIAVTCKLEKKLA